MRSKPVPAVPATPAAANDDRIRKPAGLRVVIIEDSVNMQMAMRELLDAHAGFTVVAALRSEQEATEWLLQNKNGWDVASIDLMLSDGSGFNIMQRCRAYAPTADVVIFSEYVTDVVRDRCQALGATGAFNKAQIKEYAALMDKLRDARFV